MTTAEEPRYGRRIVRLAVRLAAVGLLGVLPLLGSGFSPLTMGIGMFVGFPCLVLAMLVYVVVVVQDLRRHGLV